MATLSHSVIGRNAHMENKPFYVTWSDESNQEETCFQSKAEDDNQSNNPTIIVP